MKTDTTCTICETFYAVEPPFCSKCEYPFSALEKDKSVFVGRIFSKKLKIEEAFELKKNSTNEFNKGKLFGYYLIISKLLNQAEAFGISNKIPSQWQNFNPDELLDDIPNEG